MSWKVGKIGSELNTQSIPRIPTGDANVQGTERHLTLMYMESSAFAPLRFNGTTLVTSWSESVCFVMFRQDLSCTTRCARCLSKRRSTTPAPIYCSCRIRKIFSLAATRGLAVQAKVTSSSKSSWSAPSQVVGSVWDKIRNDRTSSI